MSASTLKRKVTSVEAITAPTAGAEAVFLSLPESLFGLGHRRGQRAKESFARARGLNPDRVVIGLCRGLARHVIEDTLAKFPRPEASRMVDLWLAGWQSELRDAGLTAHQIHLAINEALRKEQQ